MDLVAAVHGGLVPLAAALGPLDRSAEPLRDDQREDLLRVHVELAAEATADVRRDHPDLLLRDAGDQGQHDPQDVRDLRRRVQVNSSAAAIGATTTPAARSGSAAAAAGGTDAHHHGVVVGSGDGLVVGRTARERPGEAQELVPLSLWTSRRAVGDRRLHVDHRRRAARSRPRSRSSASAAV